MAMAAQQRRWVDVVPVNGNGVPPPCPTDLDLDLVVAPRPPSSVATAATAVFLLSPHLPHRLIVVSIVPRREGAMRPLLSCHRECVSL